MKLNIISEYSYIILDFNIFFVLLLFILFITDHLPSITHLVG